MDQDRIYLELVLRKSMDGDTGDVETDTNGNYIVYAEASNENVDFDGQIVLQRALTGSSQYFLKNGVISYDHRHLRPDPNDPTWNPEKYIIGQPLDVVSRGRKTFVKALLYKSNSIVQELIGKLRDGASIIKTSVGGKRPQVIQEFDAKLRKPVEKVVSVLWDELALTFKPVNQTMTSVSLTPAAFLKSLELGYSTDSATATGGAALAVQSLEGADKAKKKSKKSDITAVITALSFGDVKTEPEARQLLKNRGYTDEEATSILRHLVDNQQLVKGVLAMDKDDDLQKSFDDSIAELSKAIGGKGKPETKSDEEEDFGFNPEAGGEEDHQEPDGDEGQGEGDGDGDEAPKGDMKKSIYDTVEAQEGDYLDVAPFLRTLTKSISDAMEDIRSEIRAEIGGIKEMQKSMGKVAIAQANMLKSFGGAPAPRQTTLQKSERTFVGSTGNKQTLTRQEILQKSIDLVGTGKLDPREFAVIEDRLNQGKALSDELLRRING